MQFITTCAISLKGDRIRKGTIVDVDPALARNYGADLAPVAEAVEEPSAPAPEKPLEDMSAAELREKAAALGLSASGSKADLQERIALHLGGGPSSDEGGDA